MMRITTLVFVCASIAGCSWGGSDDGGGGGTGPDASVGASAVCGDSVCAASEVGSCTADCGNGGGNTGPTVTCGNNTCETGETSASCPADCGGGGSGSGGGACPANTQDCFGCALLGQGCPTGLDMNACLACLTGGGGGGGTGDLLCTGMAPDGTCDAQETAQTCPSDCP